MTPALRLLLYGPTLDPDAAAWLRAVSAAGSTVSRATAISVSRLAKRLKRAGLWTKMLMVRPCAGDSLTAALIRLKVPSGVAVSATNNNFGASAFVERGSTGGLTGDGSTTYLDTLVNPSTLSYDTSSFGLWSYRMTAVVGTGTSRTSIGATGAAGANSSIVGWLSSGSQENGAVAADTSTQYAGKTTTSFSGFVGVTTNGSRTQTLYRNGAQSGATAVASNSFFNGNIYEHANNLNGVVASHNVRREGSSYITTGMSAAEALTFYNIVQEFETALGRAV